MAPPAAPGSARRRASGAGRRPGPRRRRVAPPRLLGHRLEADRLQVARDVVVERRGRPRLVVQHLVQQHPRRAAERQLAGQQLVEDHAEAVDVGAAVDLVRLAAGLLGAHVGGRAQHLALERHRDLARVALGQAEVHDVRAARRRRHDVRRLDVAMDHALLVGVVQGVGDGGDSSAASRGRRRRAVSRSASVTPWTKSLTRYGRPSSGRPRGPARWTGGAAGRRCGPRRGSGPGPRRGQVAGARAP